jgi:hypothetical protein
LFVPPPKTVPPVPEARSKLVKKISTYILDSLSMSILNSLSKTAKIDGKEMGRAWQGGELWEYLFAFSDS